MYFVVAPLLQKVCLFSGKAWALMCVSVTGKVAVSVWVSHQVLQTVKAPELWEEAG